MPPQIWADPARKGAPSPPVQPHPLLIIGALAAALMLVIVIGAVVFWPESDDTPPDRTSDSKVISSPSTRPTPSPVRTRKARRVLKTLAWARTVSFSPDGETLAAGADGGSIRLWRTSGGGPTATMRFETPKLPMVAFRPDGKSLISGQWDRTVRLWDVASRSSSVIMPDPDGTGGIAMSPDGTMVARGEGKKIRLWDVTRKRTARTLSGHTKSASTVAFSPDGKLLASSSPLEKTVRIWDVASGRALQVIPSEPSQSSPTTWRSAPTERPWPSSTTTTAPNSGTSPAVN